MEVHAETLRRGLVAMGHRVTTVTTARADGLAAVEDEWGRTYHVGGGPPYTYTSQWWKQSLQRMLDIHHADPFDVIGGHGKAIYGYLRAKRGLPTADHIPTLVITHQNIVNDFQALIQQLPQQAPQLLRWVPSGIALYADDLRKLPLADVVTATNELNARALRRWFTLRPGAVEVIHNSVRVTTFERAAARRDETRARLGVLADEQMILTLARLERRKGQSYLLDALTRPEMRPYHARIKVIFAGEGVARARLEAQARQAGLDGIVTFLGLAPHAEAPALLNAADIVAHPALNEGKSLAMLEAMASSRPVIATSIDANREFLEDGRTAILVPPANADALARALAALLADPVCARALGARAHERVVASYDEPLMIACYERAFLRAAGASEEATARRKALKGEYPKTEPAHLVD
jgi:glycosyltransferase involved in cell wall biosynthesis